MRDTISAALISAVASILVAILSRGVETRARSGNQDPSSEVAFVSSRSGARWYVSSVILLIWSALSPALVHHDVAGMNFLLISLATIGLALLVPTLPLKAASITLALFAANFLLEPLSNRIGSPQYDAQFVHEPREGINPFTLLLIDFGTAAVTSVVCYLRLSFRKRSVQPTPLERVTLSPARSQARSRSGLAREIERLAKLYATHRMTDDEFQRAKEKLLGFN
jgi:hypothetical protein